MNVIAKTHEPPLIAPLISPTAQRWLDPVHGVIAQIDQALQQRQIHPAHAVVLVPYAQLMQVARMFWMQLHPHGFAPRFETTLNWARSLGGPVPGGGDIAFDAAHDLLTAHDLLERAGLQAYRQVLADRLVESAQTLGRQVAAVPPQERADWATAARSAVALGMDAPLLALESAVAQIALEWALASRYATDVLLQETAAPDVAYVVLEGFQPDPLLAPSGALGRQWGDRVTRIVLAQDGPPGAVALHAAQGAEDEAERAAACVLRHIAAGHTPVALVATDRVLTRRVRAMLDGLAVPQRDENGWKLSTTRAAAHVMGLLRACVWDASSDAVLDWLKNAPAAAPHAVAALEKCLRKTASTDWSRWVARCTRVATPSAPEHLTAQAEPWRSALQTSRPLPHWLDGLRQALQASGQWPLLEADAAGAALLATLRLTEAAQTTFMQALADTSWATRRIDLAEFTTWAQAALEAASFVPERDTDAAHEVQVVILPMSQLLARPFGAVVLPGCDEKRLAAAPEPPGTWTAAQRSALGLPTREQLQAATLAAWQHALQTPHADVLWRQGDDGGEPLLPSPLVQALQLQGTALIGTEPRDARSITPQPTLPPQAHGDSLPVQRLSASAYEDLRRCPYRFFALRQLGLKESDELEDAVDKRDFGLWLHAVLKLFHEALAADAVLDADRPTRLLRIEQAALDATRSMGLSDAAFLPFAAAWPQVRDGYLDWLATHEQSGAQFGWAERWQELPLGDLTLVGQIDRLDQLPDRSALVMDYKTEGLAVTRSRVKSPTEDTQLAFYAALQPDDTLQAAYVNIGEKSTTTVAQPDVVEVRDVLISGILHDMERIADGAAMAALGEGMACEYCAARGLCRKDFWSLT